LIKNKALEHLKKKKFILYKIFEKDPKKNNITNLTTEELKEIVSNSKNIATCYLYLIIPIGA